MQATDAKIGGDTLGEKGGKTTEMMQVTNATEWLSFDSVNGDNHEEDDVDATEWRPFVDHLFDDEKTEEIAESKEASATKDGSPLLDLSDEESTRSILQSALSLSEKYFHDHDFTSATALKIQVGGHGVSPVLSYTSKYLNQPIHDDDCSNYILKPFHGNERGLQEVAFYEAIRDSIRNTSYASLDEKNLASNAYNINLRQKAKVLRDLAPFTPAYYGVAQFSDGDSGRADMTSHIILSDITASFHRPSVMDLKMGRRTYEPDASPEKRASQTKKYPQQSQFGFRIVGMNVYEPENDESREDGYMNFGKTFGQSLGEQKDIEQAFALFFGLQQDDDDHRQASPTMTRRKVQLVTGILQRLKELHRLLQRKIMDDAFAFYSSSILIVYEGDDRLLSPEAFSLKLIDFTHVRHQQGEDENYTYGLNAVIECVESLVSQKL